jgi:hypothetical protein
VRERARHRVVRSARSGNDGPVVGNENSERSGGHLMASYAS